MVGTPVSTQAQEPFQRMILDITGRSSLTECFDAYTALTTVEYTTPRGLKTTATSESLIDALPYVLTVQLKVSTRAQPRHWLTLLSEASCV